MFITSVYDYIPRQKVTVLDISSTRKYAPVYSKPLVLHKGVDNKLSFQFLNNEQKPVNITGKEILCRVIDYTGSKILLSKTLELEFALTGIASLNLSADEIDFITPQKGYYSLEIPKDDKNFPVYLDMNAGARGNMAIVDSVLPSFIASTIVTIPTFEPDDVTFTSSVFSASSLVNTFQLTLAGYTGRIILEGSSVIDQNWYEIEVQDVVELSETIGITVKGYHPFFRFKFESVEGMVSNILVR